MKQVAYQCDPDLLPPEDDKGQPIRALLAAMLIRTVSDLVHPELRIRSYAWNWLFSKAVREEGDEGFDFQQTCHALNFDPVTIQNRIKTMDLFRFAVNCRTTKGYNMTSEAKALKKQRQGAGIGKWSREHRDPARIAASLFIRKATD